MSIGGLVGSVVGGLFGGGGGAVSGSGSTASDSWNQRPMAPGSFAQVQLGIETQHVTWMQILAGLVGSYSLVKNYQLQKRMVDLHERSVDQAEEYLTLAKRSYNEIALPTFNRTRDHYDYVRSRYRPFIDMYLVQAKKYLEYTPDYDTAMGRAMSVTQTALDRARRQRNRMRGRFEIGRACYEDALFSIKGAELRAAAADRGFRYEDAKKREMDKFYWDRLSAGAEVVANMLGNALSALNGAASMVSTSLGRVGTAVEGVGRATALMSDAVGGMRDFWGNTSGGAFKWMSNDYLRRQNSMFGGSNNMTSPSTINDIGNGAKLGIGGITGFGNRVGETNYGPRIAAHNSGEAPG